VNVVLESIEKGSGDKKGCGFGRCGATAQSTRRRGLLSFVGEPLALFRLGELVGSIADSVRFLEWVSRSICESAEIYLVGMHAGDGFRDDM
jgi:hypothetical protein